MTDNATFNCTIIVGYMDLQIIIFPKANINSTADI